MASLVGFNRCPHSMASIDGLKRQRCQAPRCWTSAKVLTPGNGVGRRQRCRMGRQDVELRRTNLTQSLRTFVGRNPKRFSKPKLLPSKEKNFDVGQGSTRAENRPKKSDQRPLEVRKLVPSREGQNSAENVRKKAEKGPRKGRKSPRIGRKWLGVQGLKTLDQASQVRSAIAREKSVRVQTKNRRRSFKDRMPFVLSRRPRFFAAE